MAAERVLRTPVCVFIDMLGMFPVMKSNQRDFKMYKQYLYADMRVIYCIVFVTYFEQTSFRRLSEPEVDDSCYRQSVSLFHACLI